MLISIRFPDAAAGQFVDRAERHLNANVWPIKALLERPLVALGDVPGVAEALLRSSALPDARGDVPASDRRSVELALELCEGRDELLRSPVRAGPEAATVAEPEAIVARLTWMLCNPSPFYGHLKTPATPAAAERLVRGFCAWFFGETPEGHPTGISSEWRLAWLDPLAFAGFYDGFYDTAFAAWRGEELSLLFQTGTD